MWLSKKLSQSMRPGDESATEIGNLTISKSDNIAASASKEIRNLSFYSSPGISFCPVEGRSVLLIDSSAGTVCAGVLSENDSSLSPGELKIYSEGGAKIVLKNDGHIVINDYLSMDKYGNVYVNGTVTAKSFITEG